MTTRPAGHLLHVTETRGAHLHLGAHGSERDLLRAAHAARVFLGPERRAPEGITPGLYRFTVDIDGNAVPGGRVEADA